MVARSEIERAVEALRGGLLVAFPTETVYGLGADASNAEAVRRLFRAKGRPATHPVIVHIGGVAVLGRFARSVPPAAERLAARFWPGPLTLILPRAAGVPDAVTGGHDTVGLRVPAHPLALALLDAFGGGIAAPSANRFGRLSPTTAEHVRAELGDAVAVILDGGPCAVGVESTIVDLAGGRPLVLRPGGVSVEALGETLGERVALAERAVRPAPGTLASHYAPATPLRLVARERLEAEVGRAAAGGKAVAVLARGEPPSGLATPATWHRAPADPAAYARALYATLRELDALGCAAILVEEPPSGEGWLAVRDRLGRAAHGAMREG